MNIFTYIKSHAVLSTGIAIVAVVTTVIAGRVANRGTTADTNLSNVRKVSLVDVSSFRDNASKISADGIVESVSQADLKSQISAPIATVDVAVGDTVSAGQTIAVLQNADIRAQLDQARAGLRIAEGQYTGSGISLDSAKRSALETIRSSYHTADEIVNGKISQFLYQSSGGNPSLSSFISDKKLAASIQDRYLSFVNSFEEWKISVNALSVSSTDLEISTALTSSQNKLKMVSLLLDDVSEAINNAVKGTPASSSFSTLSAWQTTIASSRASLDSSIKTLSSTDTTLSNAQVTYQSPAEAQISSAKAIVKNLEAQLSKTVITSPINGTISALPLRIGELAQPGQLIATVIGGGGLKVKAYASGEDLAQIKAGSKALVQGSIAGTVTAVAPGVNQTNKKAEVNISVEEVAGSVLVIGKNVTVSIDAIENVSSTKNNYLLPIQNVKIVPGDAYVFTIDSESKIVKNPVIIGKIQGDFVEIVSGINSDMKIVSPVYELEAGEIVEVQ